MTTPYNLITKLLVSQIREKAEELSRLEEERAHARAALQRVATYEHLLCAIVNHVASDIHTNYFVPIEFSLDEFLTQDMWEFSHYLDSNDYDVRMHCDKHRELIIGIYYKLTPMELDEKLRLERECDLCMTRLCCLTGWIAFGSLYLLR